MAGVEQICSGFISANKQNINKELGNKRSHTIYMQHKTLAKKIDKITLFERVINRAVN